jgi:hypothetical protein
MLAPARQSRSHATAALPALATSSLRHAPMRIGHGHASDQLRRPLRLTEGPLPLSCPPPAAAAAAAARSRSIHIARTRDKAYVEHLGQNPGAQSDRTIHGSSRIAVSSTLRPESTRVCSLACNDCPNSAGPLPRQCHCTTDVVVPRFLRDGREPETASCPPCLCAGPAPARFESRDPFFLPVAWDLSSAAMSRCVSTAAASKLSLWGLCREPAALVSRHVRCNVRAGGESRIAAN